MSAPVFRRATLPLCLGLFLTAGACGTTASPSAGVLREYRISQPQHALAAFSRLSSSASDEVAGSLSPEGTRLLYADNNKGQFDVWIRDLTTGLPRRLTTHVTEDTQPAWAPDGKRVVFVSMRNDAKGDLYLWDNGDLKRLTDSKTADAYPVFAPDGKSIYFASGDFGRPRLERLWLETGRRQSLGPENATHPAISPDGELLSYTAFDPKGRGGIQLHRLSDGKNWALTTPEYASGFPAFSADGQSIYFCRFFRGRPGAQRTGAALASLWSISVSATLAGHSTIQLTKGARQLTSDRHGVILPRAHKHGIVATVYGLKSLDLVLIPQEGSLPSKATPQDLWALLRSEADPWDKLLILRGLSHHSGQASEAVYQSAHLWLDLGEYAKAKAALDGLTRGTTGSSPVGRLARIDLATLAAQRAADKGLSAEKRAQAALLRLAKLCTNRDEARTTAYCLLRTADMHRLGGQARVAVDLYEKLLRNHRERTEYAATARLQLGRLFRLVQAPDLISAYYVSLFRSYAGQPQVLDQATQAILDTLDPLPASAQIERLRLLIDRYAQFSRFVAHASLRLARIHEQHQRLDSAIRALSAAISKKLDPQLSAKLAFETGRLSVQHSQSLRKAGQHGQALEFYRKALSAYERVLKQHEPGSEPHERAKRDYLGLALLEAAQLTRQGELSLAHKSYHRLLALDRQVVQAHRGQVRVARRTPRAKNAEDPTERLRRHYRKQLAANRSDSVAPYMLGFLETLREPLSIEHLNNAQALLEHSIALRPRSPFGHMTLGWIHEMRERYFGKTGQGWLEEAIAAYTQAHDLNDAKTDPQTEADLATNLANAYVTLGGAWQEALEFCDQRKALGIPFGSREQEAFHRLSCGRAAAARGAYARASLAFERALALSNKIDAPQLRTEIIARLSLNAHMRGHYGASSRGFERVKGLLERSGQTESLAGIERILAYNALLAGNQRAFVARIDRAEESLDRHGTPPVANLTPVALTPNPSTLPLGVDSRAARYTLNALRETAHENDNRLDLSLPLLHKRVAQQEQRGQDSTFVELRRELWLIRNRLGLTALSLGDRATFDEQLSAALSAAKAERTGETGLEGRSLTLELGLALNAAEQLIDDLAKERNLTAGRHAAMVRRLRELEQACANWAQSSGEPALSDRLQLTLWTDLALLTLQLPIGTPAPTSGSSQRTPKGTGAARRAGETLLAQLSPMSEAMAALQRVVDQTDPSIEPIDQPALVQEGPLADLMRPLSAMERLRWHVSARLNLARLASRWVPVGDLEKHPSTEILSVAAEITARHRLGPIEHVVAAELAYRRRDLQAMELAVAGLIKQHPLLLDSRSLAQAGNLRHLLFQRAVSLAQQLDAPAKALVFTELNERREFLEQLVRARPQGSTPASRKGLEALDLAAGAYRQVQSTQNPIETDEHRATWAAELKKAHEVVSRQLQALHESAPEVARLLEVGSLTVERLQQALEVDEIAVRALGSGSRVSLVILRSKGDATAVSLGITLAQLRGNLTAAAQAVRQALLPQLGKPRRLFIDLGAIHPQLSAALRPKGIPVVQLATLWQLVDARRARTVQLPGGTVATADGDQGQQLASALKFEVLTPAKTTRRELELAASRRGTVVLETPLRSAGGSAANLLTQLPGEPRKPWRLPKDLGRPLRASLLVLPSIEPRAQRIALMRMVHAMGVANVLMVQPGATGKERLTTTLAQLPQQSLASAARTSQLQLFGDGGLDPTQRADYARTRLKRWVFGGAKAFKAQPRRLPEAVGLLESALIAMEGLSDHKYLGGALLFLASAYGLQEDYPRAVQRMQQLVALRREELAKAQTPSKKQALTKAQQLKATANLVTALRQMAWLRLRNEQYDQALETNAETITIYESVKRASLVRSAYQQRGVIAEKKGDFAETLRCARKQLALAEDEAKRSKAKQVTAAKLETARAAIRVAQIERKRFSRYRPALRATRQALKLLPSGGNQGIPQLDQRIAQITRRLNVAPNDQRPRVAQRLGSLTQQRQTRIELVDTRLDALLETARIRTAQGLYALALRQAKDVLKLATAAGRPRDEALLELANNQYYLGAYERALKITEVGLATSVDKPLRQVQLLNAQGTALAALGRFAPAVKTLHRALTIARAQDIGYEIAASHNNIGHALRLAGRPRLARKSFEAALQLDRKRRDLLGQSNALANRGLTQAQLELTEEAQRDLEQAHRVAQRIGASFNQLKALAGLARLQLEQGRAGTALKHAKRGRDLARKLGLLDWLWRFHLRCGQAQLRLGQKAAAQRELEAGLAIVHSRPPQPRTHIADNSHEERPEQLYDSLIELLAQEGNAAASLGLLEALEARRFVDALGTDIEQIPWPKAAKALGHIVELSSAMAVNRAERLRQRKNAQTTAALQQQSSRLAEAQTQARAKLAEHNPRLEALALPTTPSVAEIRSALQKRLAADTAVVLYHATVNRLIVWVLDSSGASAGAKGGLHLRMQAVKLPRTRLVATLDQHDSALSRLDPADATARRLFGWMVRPVRALTQANKWLVVATGPLRRVPLATLRGPQGYLLDTTTITRARSLSAFVAASEDRPSGPRPGREEWTSFGWTGGLQSRLPFTAHESSALGRTFGRVQVFQGADADPASFVREATSAANLHLATHAEYQPRKPMDSAIRLHGGAVTLADVLALRLQADLVVLSACETAAGPRSPGQGAALQDAFRLAGAQQVVSTSRRISDLAAALLMKHLFRQLRAGHEPATALRLAQLQVRQRFPHPAFWGGFRVTGLPANPRVPQPPDL